MTIEPFIKCSDISASLKFYTETLDFTVLQEPDPDPEAFLSLYAFLQKGTGRIHLSQHEGDGVFGTVIYIRTDQIDSLYTLFVSNGLNITNPEEHPALTMPLTKQTWA